VVIEVGQQVGASALQGSAELGQLFQPGGDCGVQKVTIVAIMVFPRRRSGWEYAAMIRW
jgi:hypothetical protein